MVLPKLPFIRYLILTAFVFGLVQRRVPAEPGNDAMELNGKWRLVSVESSGGSREIDEDIRWQIKNGQVLYGGEPLATTTYYPTSSPKGIDVKLVEPNSAYEGVYSLENDELKICLNVRTIGPKARPFDFATKDNLDLRVLVFQRQSPTDMAAENVKGFIGMALAVENGAVVISDVLEKSPAEKAGLRAGDIVVAIGADQAGDLETTVAAVRRRAPGSDVLVRVRRDNNEKEIPVRVAVFPFSLLGLLG